MDLRLSRSTTGYFEEAPPAANFGTPLLTWEDFPRQFLFGLLGCGWWAVTVVSTQ